MLFPQTRNVPHGWFHEPGHHEYITMNGRGIVRVVYQTKLHNVYEAYVDGEKVGQMNTRGEAMELVHSKLWGL